MAGRQFVGKKRARDMKFPLQPLDLDAAIIIKDNIQVMLKGINCFQ